MECPAKFKEGCFLLASDKTIINVCPNYSRCYEKSMRHGTNNQKEK